MAQQKIKIGVPTSLTGDAASFGIDIKNALTLMNDKFGNGRYELIFEDDMCTGKGAVAAAQRLIGVEKVRYALGFACNQALLVVAALYDKAGVVVVTSSATSGDVLDLGKHIFRLFPSDAVGAQLLFQFISKRHKKLLVLTEQNEYPVMMERTMLKANKNADSALEITSVAFTHGESDLRTVLLSTLAKGTDAIFINANSDSSFITVVQQLQALKYSGARYAAYVPASAVAQQALGETLDGIIFCNLPALDDLMTTTGKELLAEFRKRYGEPQSGFPVVPTSFEAFQVLDAAIQSGRDPTQFLATTKFKGEFIPDFYFDQNGAVQGIDFQIQKIENGKVVVLKD